MPPLDAAALAVDPDEETAGRAAALNDRYSGRDAQDVIALSIDELFPGRIASVSSFGSESVVLLHLLAEIDKNVPVLFVDTGRLFPETIEYRSRITKLLGLTDVRTIQPSAERLAALDPGEGIVDEQSRSLLPHPQDRTAEPSDQRLRCVVHRAEALPDARTLSAAAVRSRRTQDQGQPAGRVGARPISSPMPKNMTCRRTRWSPKAIRRSAAYRARTASCPAKTSAPAAGAVRTRTSAAFTSAWRATVAAFDRDLEGRRVRRRHLDDGGRR